ncbi:MAG: DUF1588 domain-containing protein [Myxococcota bacterium]
MNAWLRWGCAALLLASCRDAEEVANSADSDGPDGGSSTTGETPEHDPPSAAEPKAGRLTHLQYRYAVLDVLGVEMTDDEIDALPRDIPTGRDYSTTIGPQSFNSSYVLAYAQIARSVTERLDLDQLVAEVAGCDGIDPSCRPALVERLGLQMYRRPLTPDEQERYLDLATAIAAASETTEHDVVRGIVQAMMQAPSFLYRIENEIEGEPGTVHVVDGYELATRLSFFLWQSAPDEELLEFAAGPEGDGEFDPDAVSEQIDRMLADPRFARSRSLFWGDYTLASRSAFGTSDTALADELRNSLVATLERISGASGSEEPLSALFDGRELVMTPAVAELAGATVQGEGLQVYDVADMDERLGVVTHPAMLASMGTTSFVGRGLFLSERLLCQRVATPPDEVSEDIENTAQATEDMTPREASEFRFGLEPVCLSCHTQFEPIAYAFERYDITGHFSTVDEHGRALFSHGVLPPNGDRPEIAFADAPELLSQLAQDQTVYRCLVDNMTEFGTGQPPSALGNFLDLATVAFLRDGLTFEQLVRAVATNEQRTLTRVVEP